MKKEHPANFVSISEVLTFTVTVLFDQQLFERIALCPTPICICKNDILCVCFLTVLYSLRISRKVCSLKLCQFLFGPQDTTKDLPIRERGRPPTMKEPKTGHCASVSALSMVFTADNGA